MQPDYEHLELNLDMYAEAPKPFTRWDRYVMWSSLHTMNPLAWPFVIYLSIVIYLDKRAHKDD